MHASFKKIRPIEIADNPFKLIDKDWMLISAGSLDKYNTMTASWGHLGIMWNLPVAIAWIRPQRYTFGFANSNEYYTLSFFPERFRTALQFCGTRSGRDYDKAAETGLTPMATELGNVCFEEARLVLECRKMYADDLKKKNFISPDVPGKHYPKDDFHRFYMGEIVNSYLKEQG